MAVKRAVTPPGAATAGDDPDPVIVADGISKRYPCERVRLFPPVQMFHHRFKFRRSSEDDEPAASEGKSRAEADPGASRSGVRVRRRRERERDYDDLDEDDEDDEDDDDDDLAPGRVGGPTPTDPGEMFWALKDVSLSLPPGTALGVLGGPGAGKSTLLNVLGGRVFPTEGRVMTRGVISPVPTDLAKAIALTGKGYFKFDLVMGCRLLGIRSHLVKKYREEIEELAEPVLGPDGEPAPGAMARLAAATAVTLPADAILFDDGVRGLDDAFLARIADRLRERVREGASLMYASRRPDAIRELCDEVILMQGGSIVERGPAKVAADALGLVQNGGGDGGAPRRSAEPAPPPAGDTSPLLGRELRVPSAPAPFHSSAALISVELQTVDGSRSKRIDAGDDLAVRIHLETAQPDTEVHCGVCFTPRSGETGVRVEHPEPLRLRDPQAYEVLVRVPAGTLPSGGYRVHANALIATASEPDASAITRDAGRLRIVGEAGSEQEPPAAPVEHWDGCVSRRADAEWSIR